MGAAADAQGVGPLSSGESKGGWNERKLNHVSAKRTLVLSVAVGSYSLEPLLQEQREVAHPRDRLARRDFLCPRKKYQKLKVKGDCHE